MTPVIRELTPEDAGPFVQLSVDDDSLPLELARSQYFARNGIPPDGGYAARWIKVTKKRLPLYILNTPPRRRAVPYHDLHHVLTGYESTNRGESEIAAWELAAGTGPRWMALVLDLAALGLGLFLAPRRTFRAFVRGCGCRSLYAEPLNESLLSARVGEVRARLGLDRPISRATLGNYCAFTLYALAGLSTLLGFLLFGPFAVVFGLLAQLWESVFGRPNR